MKSRIIVLIAILGFLVSCNIQDNNFELIGENLNEYDGCQIYLFSYGYTPVSKVDTLGIQPIVDGSFKIKGSIDFTYPAIFSIKKEGKTQMKGSFILEKGILNLMISKRKDVFISGGKYNDIVINSWKSTDEYLSRIKQIQDLRYNTESENKQKISREERNEIYTEIRNIKQEKLDDVALNHEDPIARLMALGQGGIKDLEKKLVLIDALAKETGENKTWVNLKYNIESRKESRARKNEVLVGKNIKDFTAQDINGSEFHLADILKKNKYVLVEFWASWCGPCRQEIPYMKKAYEKFHSKGFEIISFSLDIDNEKWLKASEIEMIPWLNTGDLKGYESPITKMYGVSGVPANFLVSDDGKIIAKDLRHEDLSNKLTELLN